jgi:hypothetical protein
MSLRTLKCNFISAVLTALTNYIRWTKMQDQSLEILYLGLYIFWKTLQLNMNVLAGLSLETKSYFSLYGSHFWKMAF